MCALWSKKDDEIKREKQIIFNLLKDIRDQRAKLRLEFEENVTTIKEISATLVDFDMNGVSVEVTSIKGVSSAFEGAYVTCFFRVRDREARSREQYLSFGSQILAARVLGNGVVQFSLAFPQNLKSSQLRRGVRVTVNTRQVPELIVWPDFSGKQDLSALTPVFGAAQLDNKRFRVDNFSANGFRLLVNNSLMHESMPQSVKGTRYVVSFHASSDQGKPAETFWTSALLRNVFLDPMLGETALGFEFIAVGSMDEEDGLVWQPLKLDEVSGLGKLVFKWNLDLYREKGISDD